MIHIASQRKMCRSAAVFLRSSVREFFFATVALGLLTMSSGQIDESSQ